MIKIKKDRVKFPSKLDYRCLMCKVQKGFLRQHDYPKVEIKPKGRNYILLTNKLHYKKNDWVF